ncbi:uncharacterized protein LOC134282082 isoform X1 [Saccostrea cucullata]|uniref:uncharacterized protein LOC134282082 isoform X1 n=1 Tax=Saccostrea cuccullata TaxID=36930 RepID=UPI002ED3ED50
MMYSGNMSDSDRQDRGTMPQRGKVAKVRQEFMVHEDGAMAYQEQNEEFERHYGLNRFNRRTVREDIPVARVVQTEEECRQQEQRYQELQALNMQAEEDAEIARRIEQDLMGEEAAQKRQREQQDEEMARKAFEKEQQRYEKYMEKKRIKELKREREILEQQLQHSSEVAGLVARSLPPDVVGANEAMREVRLNNGAVDRQTQNYQHSRVTHTGRIEDDGDFSDFYPHLPEHVDENQRRFIQETADEELARLLQEQEHKRSKAEVDRNKLREIEEQDERLAKIIQEQEKIKLKKAKQKKKKEQEEKNKQQQVTNPATRPLPDLPGQRSDIPVQRSHDHHRLRRDSFLQSLNNGPADNSGSQRSPENHNSSAHSSQSHGAYNSSQRSNISQRAPRMDQRLPSRGDSSASSVQNVERWLENSVMESQGPPPRGRIHSNRSDLSDHVPSLSPPGSYHSDEEIPYRPPPQQSRVSSRPPEENHYAVSNPMPFNIAAAIDPTYHRRAHEFQQDETEAKVPVTLASSLPVRETELEWDPSLRGSLRRPKGTWNQMAFQRGFIGDTGVSRDDNFSQEGSVISPWQPVQGQKRSTLDKQKRASTGNAKHDKVKGNCKQQ